jgi:hypothetical protein
VLPLSEPISSREDVSERSAVIIDAFREAYDEVDRL